MQFKIFVCDNSIDGIFTAIYKAWSSGFGHANIKLQVKCDDSNFSNMELFSEYMEVITDYELSMKVAGSIKKKLSDLIYEMVCKTALSNHGGKADLIYRFLILAFAVGTDILNHLSNETVASIYKTSRYVSGEAHNLLGFIRFSEQENGLLTSVIHPKNNVISLVAPHFADRLSKERFIIYDENRRVAALHTPKKPWILVSMELEDEVLKKESFEEDGYQDLWRSFIEHIAIKERTNQKLQRNNLPLRYRSDMIEFIRNA